MSPLGVSTLSSSSTTGSAPSARARPTGSGPGPARTISSFSPAIRRTFPSVFRRSGKRPASRRCTWSFLTGRCSPASRPRPRSFSGCGDGGVPPPCSASREPGSSPAPSTGGSPRGGIAFTAGSKNRPVDGKASVPIPGNGSPDPAQEKRDPGNALTDPAQYEYDSFQKMSSAKSFSLPVSPGPRGEVPGRFLIPSGNISASVGRKQGGERIRQGGTNDP